MGWVSGNKATEYERARIYEFGFVIFVKNSYFVAK